MKRIKWNCTTTSGGGGGTATTTTTISRANFNWYAPIDTWRAGFVAGAVQSLAAAPVDAIYTRLTVAEMLEGSHENLWVLDLINYEKLD